MNEDHVEITLLVDNQAGPGLIAEHGLSVWIEARGKRILLDTGQGGALAPNARTLGIQLNSADMLVLSHGHFDHTGGLAQVLNNGSGKTHLYCHSGVVQPRYSIRNGMARPIHMPVRAAAAMDRLPDERLHWVYRFMEIAPGIGLTGPIPRNTAYEDAGGPFFLDLSGRRPDPVEDDLSLWLSTAGGLVVISGCCHAGLVNTLAHVRLQSGEPRIRAVIGGFHLLSADDRRLQLTAEALAALEPEMVIPCHCTGETAVRTFKRLLGDRVATGRSGMTFRF